MISFCNRGINPGMISSKHTVHILYVFYIVKLSKVLYLIWFFPCLAPLLRFLSKNNWCWHLTNLVIYTQINLLSFPLLYIYYIVVFYYIDFVSLRGHFFTSNQIEIFYSSYQRGNFWGELSHTNCILEIHTSLKGYFLDHLHQNPQMWPER